MYNLDKIEKALGGNVPELEFIFTLTPREYAIMYHRWGLKDGMAHTLEETGKEYGVTRERIRQIEAKSLEKIRQYKYKFMGWRPTPSQGTQSQKVEP